LRPVIRSNFSSRDNVQEDEDDIRTFVDCVVNCLLPVLVVVVSSGSSFWIPVDVVVEPQKALLLILLLPTNAADSNNDRHLPAAAAAAAVFERVKPVTATVRIVDDALLMLLLFYTIRVFRVGTIRASLSPVYDLGNISLRVLVCMPIFHLIQDLI